MIRTGENGVEVKSLRDLLVQWGCSEELTSKMSKKWRCKEVPLARTREEVFEHVTNGVPVLLGDSKYAQRPFQKIETEGRGCALDYYCGDHDGTGNKFSSFERPKIAFLGGWGRPGTDMTSEEYMALVRNFSDVVDPNNTTPRNLQMFHRDESDGSGAQQVPVLPRELEWPLPELLGGTGYDQNGVVVDNATRLSQRGAVTWWHLDDGGEFVLQVGLPLHTNKQSNPHVWDESGKPIVKIFIFASKSYYKLIMQDLETNKTGRAACLDLFGTPTEYLPEIKVSREGDQEGEEDDQILPVFWVAPLLAGGYPLLSPPNAPHMVLTVQDCVMIEQRRISKLFLDEVEYFLRRAAIWNAPPICYEFIQKDLQDTNKIVSSVVKPLIHQVESLYIEEGGKDLNPGKVLPPEKLRVAVRICCSLKSLLVKDFFPQTEEITDLISKLVAKFEAFLQLDQRERERQTLIEDMNQEENGLYSHRGKGIGSDSSSSDCSTTLSFFAQVHEKGCPRWGPRRCSRVDALKDRKKLKRAAIERKLHETLVQMKEKA